MKLRFIAALILCLLLTGCAPVEEPAQVAATTLPVYEFTSILCQGTGITVARVVTESVSCLHDYTLDVRQVRALEGAELTVISGGGLESFLGDFTEETVVDSSSGIHLIGCEQEHDHDHDHGHSHEEDPHIWLSPENAKIMAQNICTGLKARYPQHADTFQTNLAELLEQLDALQQYGTQQLRDLRCRELLTFHDGFAYFAESFGLTILRAVEEESGSEASAKELIELIRLVEEHHLPAIFTETNGSTSAAAIIAAETGAKVFALDMAMAGSSYFEAMYHNIDTIKEALQ